MEQVKVSESPSNIFHPFNSEYEETQYRNRYVEVICKQIIEYDGSGKFGSDNLQLIADAFFNASNPNLEELKSEDSWISVNDELPKLPRPYYHSGYKTLLTPMVSRCLASDGSLVFEESYDAEGFRDKEITHWRYLPKPPKTIK